MLKEHFKLKDRSPGGKDSNMLKRVLIPISVNPWTRNGYVGSRVKGIFRQESLKPPPSTV